MICLASPYNLRAYARISDKDNKNNRIFDSDKLTNTFEMIQADKNIILPAPSRSGGMPLMEALANRSSQREFSSRELDLQTLSDLLWAAFGFRCERRRTAPSSHNRQETELYIFLKSGVYVYDAEANSLVCVDSRDLSSLTGTQDFVCVAPVNIAMVADRTKIKGKTPQGVIETIYADTGFISQNIYLFCTSAGLSSVTRAMIDKEALAEALELSQDKTITLIHTVGWPAARG